MVGGAANLIEPIRLPEEKARSQSPSQKAEDGRNSVFQIRRRQMVGARLSAASVELSPSVWLLVLGVPVLVRRQQGMMPSRLEGCCARLFVELREASERGDVHSL